MRSQSAADTPNESNTRGSFIQSGGFIHPVHSAGATENRLTAICGVLVAGEGLSVLHQNSTASIALAQKTRQGEDVENVG